MCEDVEVDEYHPVLLEDVFSEGSLRVMDSIQLLQRSRLGRSTRLGEESRAVVLGARHSGSEFLLDNLTGVSVGGSDDVTMLEPVQEDEELISSKFSDHDWLCGIGNAARRNEDKLALG